MRRARGILRVLTLPIAVVLVATGCGGPGGPASTGPDRAPDFEAVDVNGKTFRFAETDGKLRLVNFWATWCAPCREEIPTFRELQSLYGPRGFQMVAVAMDEEGASVVEPFLREYGIDYLNVLGDDAIAEQFGGIVGYPTSILVDPSGKIVARWVGLVPKKILVKEIEARLGA